MGEPLYMDVPGVNWLIVSLGDEFKCKRYECPNYRQYYLKNGGDQFDIRKCVAEGSVLEGCGLAIIAIKNIVKQKEVTKDAS